MVRPESSVEKAERHVREGEERVARQASILEKIERSKNPGGAAQALEVLTTLQASLDLMRTHLRMERAARGLES